MQWDYCAPASPLLLHYDIKEWWKVKLQKQPWILPGLKVANEEAPIIIQKPYNSVSPLDALLMPPRRVALDTLNPNQLDSVGEGRGKAGRQKVALGL